MAEIGDPLRKIVVVPNDVPVELPEPRETPVKVPEREPADTWLPMRRKTSLKVPSEDTI
jgi:hypothetical protein